MSMWDDPTLRRSNLDRKREKFASRKCRRLLDDPKYIPSLQSDGGTSEDDDDEFHGGSWLQRSELDKKREKYARRKLLQLLEDPKYASNEALWNTGFPRHDTTDIGTAMDMNGRLSQETLQGTSRTSNGVFRSSVTEEKFRVRRVVGWPTQGKEANMEAPQPLRTLNSFV